MKTAAYIRVSSRTQKTDSQRAEIQGWLKRQRIKGVQWYEDHESGTTIKRPAFKKLQDAIFAGEIDTVVIWKLDRMARNQKDGITVLADWCQRQVRVISVTQQIDLTGTLGHIVAGVLFGIAEIENQYRRERQAIGIAVAKKRGVYTGRKEGTMKAEPARARALRKRGFKIPEIAQALGIKQRTVYNYLQNG